MRQKCINCRHYRYGECRFGEDKGLNYKGFILYSFEATRFNNCIRFKEKIDER